MLRGRWGAIRCRQSFSRCQCERLPQYHIVAWPTPTSIVLVAHSSFWLVIRGGGGRWWWWPSTRGRRRGCHGRWGPSLSPCFVWGWLGHRRREGISGVRSTIIELGHLFTMGVEKYHVWYVGWWCCKVTDPQGTRKPTFQFQPKSTNVQNIFCPHSSSYQTVWMLYLCRLLL